MEFKDYYATLGVAATATADEVKRAYRKAARRYHPDVSKEKDAEARFKEVGEAYEVLSDPEKRARYDRLRAGGGRDAGGGWQFHGGPGAHADAGTNADPAAFSDFFRSIFGDGHAYGRGHAHGRGHAYGGGHAFDAFGDAARHGGSRRGGDLRYRLALTLEEAFAGTTQTIRYELPDAASGQLREKSLRVTVPPGVAHGDEIRLQGQGLPAAGGRPAGHLYVQIEVAPHPRYALEGRDVHLAVPITPWEAALGGRIRVPTLGGPVDVRVPDATRDAPVLRLKGRGLPAHGRHAAGDQYLHFQIVVPKPRSARERELYAALAALPHDDVRAGLAS
jgi:curved DNA-binding protein